MISRRVATALAPRKRKNLVDNGQFDDSTGWYSSQATLTISGGTARYNTATNGVVFRDLNETVVSGGVYEISFDLVAWASGQQSVAIGGGSNVEFSNTLGRKVIQVTAGSGNQWLMYYGGYFNVGGDSTIDNLVVVRLS